MNPPWGLAGGSDGTLSAKTLVRDGKTIALRALSSIDTQKGDRLIVETSGGGGFGNPRERTEEAIRNDLADGTITPLTARDIYGLSVEH